MTYSTETEDKITMLNNTYMLATGLSSRLEIGGGERQRWWYLFIKHSFTREDLMAVVTWLQAQVRIGKRRPGCLKLSNLIGNLGFFEEELSQIRHRKQFAKRKLTPKEQILLASGRPPESKPVVKSGNALLASAFADLARQFKP